MDRSQQRNIKSINEESNNIQEIIINKESKKNNYKNYMGARGAVLALLKNSIDKIENNTVNDYEIENVAKSIFFFAKTLEFSHIEKILTDIKINSNIPKYTKKQLKNINYKLNNSERALLKSQMKGIVLEYMTVDGNYTLRDYGAMRVAFEVAYQAITHGLREESIGMITLDVGYGDTLENIKIEYNIENYEHDLDEDRVIFCLWNSLDELYRYHSIYKTKYSDFSKESINSLATAKSTLDEFRKRSKGRELISYRGIAMNYLGVLEEELKKLISKSFNIDINSITFKDSISYLERVKFEYLSDKETIESLNKMRKLKTKAAHYGKEIRYNEIDIIEDELIDNQILQFIDWHLKEVRFSNGL